MTARHRMVAIIAVSFALAIAVIAGYWWGHSRGIASTATARSEAVTGREVLYWYDPMAPQERYANPGKSSMGMTLVPKYAEAAQAGISIPSSVRQNVGIRTVVVRRGRLATVMQVPGTIGWDLRQERIVSARVEAIVERLYVRTPFEPVRAGQPLASVIAPAWSTALAEAQALGQARSASARTLQSASRERLHALGLPAGARGAGGGRFTLTSPVTGVVSEIGVREGQSAPIGTLLFRVNGTRTVWLEASIPQADVAGISAGTPVDVAVDARPGTTFHGRVQTLLPQIDAGSRTQRARIVLDNPDGSLAPGMFVQVNLHPESAVERPLVPTDALIGAGAQTRVIVLDADATFRPVIVQAGRSSDGMTEILVGLQGGERVVASGQFLIDSEANLSGALERLGAGTVEPVDTGTHGEALPGAIAPGTPSEQLSSSPRAKPVSPTPAPGNSKPTAPPNQGHRKILYWYDPAMPDRHFDKPGKSPYMDMPLVPRYAGDVEANARESQR